MVDIQDLVPIITILNLALAFALMLSLWMVAGRLKGKSMTNTLRILALAFVPFLATLVTEFVKVSYPWWSLLNLFSHTVFLLSMFYALHLVKSSVEAYSHFLQKKRQ